MRLFISPDFQQWPSILARPTQQMADIEQIVGPILQQVKDHGDDALRALALKYDGSAPAEFLVPQATIKAAAAQLSYELKEAIQVAYQNIRTFHAAQITEPKIIETMPGVACWRKSIPIQKVGLYIPGGSAPLFSTVLMLGVPAQLVACREIVLCSPSVHPAILYAADLVGIKKIYTVGGAQAIASMAYGTESIPAVFKIFGPGNQYVTAAKQLVAKEGLAIDMPAGPSEVAVYADATASPAFVAADLLAQAEHGPDSQVLLVCTSTQIFEAVSLEIKEQLNSLPRAAIAMAALENSSCIVEPNAEKAIQILNDYAAEHLIIQCQDAEYFAEQITDAGSIFIGPYTPESCGDYASGTNHTLPTNGFARAYSGVSVDSFVKKITYQKITQEGLKQLGPHVEHMAAAEQLNAHQNAVSIRLKTL